MQALPKLIAEAPTIIDKLIKAMIDVVPELVQGVPDAIVNGIGEGLISFDWSGFAQQAMTNLGNALEDAQKGLALVWDGWLTNGSVYGGDINNVSTTGMIDAYSWLFSFHIYYKSFRISVATSIGVNFYTYLPLLILKNKKTVYSL